MIKVSVISPIFNVEKYLPRFLNSVENQTLKDIEIILVDDGSTDNSLQICQDFSTKHENIRVIHQKNTGVGSARNKGLSLATGKYVYFCDPDDYLEKDLLQDNYVLAEKSKAQLVIFGFYVEKPDHEIIRRLSPENAVYKDNNAFRPTFIKLYHESILYFVWNKLYLRDSIKTKRFDKGCEGEDVRFNINYCEDVQRIVCNDQCYYHYIIMRKDSALYSWTLNKVSLRVNEVKKLENLLYKEWNLSNDPAAIGLVNAEYVSTMMKLVWMRSKGLLKRIDFDSNLKKYLVFNKYNDLKTNGEILFLKLVRMPGMLTIYRLLLKIKNNL